jgi:pilus assembly protein CpaE
MTQTASHYDQNQSQPQVPVAYIPRINIHTFCDNQQTGEIIQVAAMDRRMSKAHVTIQLGGIHAAIQVYQTQPTPNLLVLESHASRDQLIVELAQLAEVCQPNTKVMIIGHVNDVLLYRELMRQGISEYLVAPFNQMQFIEAVSNLYRDPGADPLGKIVAFVGVKGGVGSSTLAHNIGWKLSNKHGLETIITDLDLAFGTAGLNFNSDSGGSILEALGSPDRVDTTLMDRLLTKLGDKLSLLNGPGAVDREYSFEASAVETVLNTVRQSVPFVIVDVPNLWAPWVKQTLVDADEVIITASPELPSLRNAKNLIDMLKAARSNDKAPDLVLNQMGIPKRPEISAVEFGKAVGLPVSHVIPHDPHTFGTAQGNGKMVFEVGAKTKAAEVMSQIAAKLAGQDKAQKPAASGLSGLMQKLPMLRKK